MQRTSAQRTSTQMDDVTQGAPATAVRAKFSDPVWTAKGDVRAVVPFVGLTTLWFNTGTLCNIACHNCYIESSPKNDALVYLSRAEVKTFLDQAVAAPVRPIEIGYTGGEPFMNPDMIGILEDTLEAGFKVLLLSNAMKPLQHKKAALLALHQRFAGQITVRVSVDHYTSAKHEQLRGPRTWEPSLAGLMWLAENGFDVAVAGRTIWNEPFADLRVGFAKLFAEHGLAIDANDQNQLVLFPEMETEEDVPEISTGCWDILGQKPADIMCATSRMVVKRKGADAPVVLSCTLLPYDARFEMGQTLQEAGVPVSLNHSHCARFCVLGGASCSGGANSCQG
jgi:sulfatase maturation enzyme AslB (radical SAM superfamily)